MSVRMMVVRKKKAIKLRAWDAGLGVPGSCASHEPSLSHIFQCRRRRGMLEKSAKIDYTV